MELSGHSISRTYSSVFILDMSKMARLSNIIEERFKSINPPFLASLEIKTAKGKSFSAPIIENILEHDNAIKNPITSFKMSYQNNGDNPANSCVIIFDKKDSEIDVRISSDNAKWANDLFAEIDEQIERTSVHSWVYSLKKQRANEIFSLILAVVLAVPLSFSIFSMLAHDINKEPSKINYLTQADIESLQKLQRPDVDNNGKINFLYQLHTRQLINCNPTVKPSATLSDNLSQLRNYVNLPALFILLPVILIIPCIFYLFKYCYPGSIFLWGDYIEHYKTILDRRKFIWNAIVIAFIVSILGNLFFFGMSRSL